MFCGTSRLLRKRCDELTTRLYRLAWSWCHDRELADELVQETWARALERCSQLQDRSKLLPWLSRMMVNIYRDRLRRERTVEAMDPAELAGPDTVADALDRQSEIVRVRQAVASLPEEQRLVLTLVDLMELSYAQVADTLDIPVGTVMSRVSRARRRLRALLEPGQAAHQRSALRSVQ